MTAVPDIHEFRSGVAADDAAVLVRPYHLEEVYWGYIVHSGRRVSTGLMLVQAASLMMAITFAFVVLGMWAISPVGTGEGLLTFKIGASVPMIAAAALLFWFASRGTFIDVQVDTKRGEVREVLRNRNGRATLLGLYGFDSIGGVFLERSSHGARGNAHARLVLRYRNTPHVLPVAQGPEAMLELLRDRLGRDLMVKRGLSHRIAAEAGAHISRAA